MVGGWRLAIVGWWLVVVGGWWLAVGGEQLVEMGGWRLVAVGGWRLVVLGGCPEGQSLIKTKLVFLRTVLILGPRHCPWGRGGATFYEGRGGVAGNNPCCTGVPRAGKIVIEISFRRLWCKPSMSA